MFIRLTPFSYIDGIEGCVFIASDGDTRNRVPDGKNFRHWPLGLRGYLALK